MGEIVVFALLSAVYPTLIAATTVMLLLPKAEALMLGFWLAAMITSVTCGLVIVFSLHDSSAVKTARHSVSPGLDLVFAALLVLAAVALAKGEDRRARANGTTRVTQAKTGRRQSGGSGCRTATLGTRSWWASCCRFPASGISRPSIA